MTLEYLELMEDLKKQEKEVQGTSSPRRKLQKSFKSNTRIYDDGSIEVDPQAQGEPSQKDVKKVGKSKRYVTNGKNPLTCVELKCPENVPDKAALPGTSSGHFSSTHVSGFLPEVTYRFDLPTFFTSFCEGSP